MSTFYDNMAETALSLLSQFGQSVTIKRETNTIDPITGVTSTVTVTGSFTAINPPASGGTVEAFDNRLGGEAALLYENLRFLIIAASGAPFEPRANDLVQMGGVWYTVLGMTPISPAGTPLVYKVGMKV
jgi:hypothetical protein